jgi:aromatic-L-amino-acid/L-tryptophan decarboxylase
MNQKLLENLNNSGKIYLVHTELKKKFVIRFSVGGSDTKKQHVIDAWDLIKSETDKLLSNE